MPKYTLAATVVVFFLWIRSTAAADSSRLATLERASRLLQAASFTIGNYTGTRSANVKTYCSDKGVSTNDLNMSDGDFNSSMRAMSDRYVGPRAQLETAFKGQNFSNFNVPAAINSTILEIGLSAALSLFSVFSMVFFLFWACCEGLYKETKCMKKLEPGEVRLSQKILAVSNVLVGAGMLACLVIWSLQVSQTISTARYLTCEMASLSSDLIVGVQYPDRNLTFLGIEGFNSMIKSLNAAINNFRNTPCTLSTMGLSTQGDALVTQLDTFWNSFNPAVVANANKMMLEVGRNGTLPNSIKALSQTVNIALRNEINSLVFYGKSLHQVGVTMDNIKSSGGANLIKALDDLLKSINGLRKPADAVGEQGIKSLQIETIKAIMDAALIASASLIGLLTLTYFITMAIMIFKNKCTCSRTANKFILVIKATLAVFLNLAALAFIIASIVVSNFCYFIFKASTDPAYADSLSKSQLKDVITTCVLPTGTGNLMTLLGSNSSDPVAQITQLTDSVQSIFNDTYAQNFSGTPVPYVGVTQLQTQYQAFFDCRDDDLSSLTGNTATTGLKTGLDDFNSHMSGTLHSNRMRLKGQCDGGYTVSAVGDAETFRHQLADNYCLQMCTFPFNNAAVTNRYNIFLYLGGPNARTKYNLVQNSFTTYLSKITAGGASSFRNMYGFPGSPTGLSISEQAYFNLLKSAYPQVQTLRSAAARLSEFMKSFSNNFSSSLNCSIVGIHARQLQVAMCAKTGAQFMTQTTTMVYLSASVFLFSWCMCCGLRCLPVPKPKSDMSASPQNMNASLMNASIMSENNVNRNEGSFVQPSNQSFLTIPQSQQTSPVPKPFRQGWQGQGSSENTRQFTPTPVYQMRGPSMYESYHGPQQSAAAPTRYENEMTFVQAAPQSTGYRPEVVAANPQPYDFGNMGNIEMPPPPPVVITFNEYLDSHLY